MFTHTSKSQIESIQKFKKLLIRLHSANNHNNFENKHTHGGDPLDSSIATPMTDMRTPNQVRAGTTAPKTPSSIGTTST